MKRFDIRGEQWRLVKRADGLGAMCWAEDALWYRRQYVMSLIINLVVVLACEVLAGYLVYHKHDPTPVMTPALDLVPSQPIILEAVKKEAATEQGLRQVVARNFGKDIAGRVRVEP